VIPSSFAEAAAAQGNLAPPLSASAFFFYRAPADVEVVSMLAGIRFEG